MSDLLSEATMLELMAISRARTGQTVPGTKQEMVLCLAELFGALNADGSFEEAVEVAPTAWGEST